MPSVRPILAPGVAAAALMAVSVLAGHRGPSPVRQTAQAHHAVRRIGFHPVIETASFPPPEYPPATPSTAAAPHPSPTPVHAAPKPRNARPAPPGAVPRHAGEPHPAPTSSSLLPVPSGPQTLAALMP